MRNKLVTIRLVTLAAAGLAVSIPAFADTIKEHGRAGDEVTSHEFAHEDKDFTITNGSKGRKGAHEFVHDMRRGKGSGSARFDMPDAEKNNFHPIIVPEGQLKLGDGKQTVAVPEPGVLGLLQVGLIGVLSAGTFRRRRKS